MDYFGATNRIEAPITQAGVCVMRHRVKHSVMKISYTLKMNTRLHGESSEVTRHLEYPRPGPMPIVRSTVEYYPVVSSFKTSDAHITMQ